MITIIGQSFVTGLIYGKTVKIQQIHPSSIYMVEEFHKTRDFPQIKENDIGSAVSTIDVI